MYQAPSLNKSTVTKLIVNIFYYYHPAGLAFCFIFFDFIIFMIFYSSQFIFL
jgi:hypothetical protein